MLISAIAIIVMAICAMVLFYDILKKQIFDDLKANAHVISMMNPEDLPDEINYNLNKDGLRITLINEDGTVIYDSMEDESKPHTWFMILSLDSTIPMLMTRYLKSSNSL